MRKIHILFLIIYSFAVLYSCNTADDKAAWEVISSNKTNKEQLQKIYELYKKTNAGNPIPSSSDAESASQNGAIMQTSGNTEHKSKKQLRLRHEAALFLLANMGNKYSTNDGNIAERYHEYIDSMLVSQNGAVVNNQRLLGRKLGASYKRQRNFVFDQDVINADSLRANIDMAFTAWDHSPWKDRYSFSQFKEYVLPYRGFYEPMELYWREDLYGRLSQKIRLSDTTDVIEAAVAVNNQLGFTNNNLFFYSAIQPYSSLIQNMRGKCDDRTLLGVLAMRAMGIPAAFDIIPQWGSRNNGHTMSAIILPDETFIPFNEDLGGGRRFYLYEKVAKVYRICYSIRKDTPLYELRDEEYIPSAFTNFDYRDVTAGYDVKTASAEVAATGTQKNRLMFLALFSSGGRWEPVAWSRIHSGKARFYDLGTGYNGGQEAVNRGENIGDGIVYLPVCYQDEAQAPAGYPFILRYDSTRTELKPDHTMNRTVCLGRKSPRVKRIVDYARDMSGGVFEGASRGDFSDAETLYSITGIPASRMQNIDIASPGRYRYFRYKKRKGGISIAELEVYDTEGNMVKGKIIADDFIRGESELANVFDKDPLTYFAVKDLSDTWLGLEFPRPVRIGSIRFAPRNDDNEIRPGDTYELLYWNKEWVSLGKKTADGYTLSYDNVPGNALLWLRNHTRGVEERPFTYEGEKQIWW